MENKTCPDCNHSLMNNSHGFDQDDYYWNADEDTYKHKDSCKYCNVCYPRKQTGSAPCPECGAEGFHKMSCDSRPKLVQTGWKSDGMMP